MYTLNTGPNCSICVPRRSVSYVGLHGILARLLTSLDAHQEVMANSGLGIHIVVFRLAAALPHNPRNNNMNIQPTVCRHLLVGIKTGDEPGKYAMQSYLSSFSGHIRYTYFMLFSSGLSTVLACMMMASDFSRGLTGFCPACSLPLFVQQSRQAASLHSGFPILRLWC